MGFSEWLAELQESRKASMSKKMARMHEGYEPSRQRQQAMQRPHASQPQQQQLMAVQPAIETAQREPAKPLTTTVYSVTWNCRLTNFARLPLPWEA